MTAGGHALEPYQLRLAGFEGPLDVLLRLIERRELEITDLSLVAVTGQFLAHIDALDQRDPHLLVEFLAIATRLLVLKTRGLFPQAPSLPSDTGDVDPDDLARQLRDYQRFKEVALQLGRLERNGHRAFEPARPTADSTTLLPVLVAPAWPADLVRAVHSRLAAAAPLPALLELTRLVSVAEMAARIRTQLRLAHRGLRFSDLIRDATGRGDVITAFLALLDLVRRGQVEATQPVLFGDIVVHRTTAKQTASDRRA